MNDIISDNIGILTSLESYKMLPSRQLDIHSPIKIKMVSSHKNSLDSIKRIGVLFGTYVRQNPGESKLRLNGPDGSKFVQRFSLPNLADNKYRYFELDSKQYTSGEIVSVRVGGISTWESHDENGDADTYIIYIYTNGKRRFTPGCPLF